MLVREDDGLHAVADVQLLQQVAHVRLDRRERDEELLGGAFASLSNGLAVVTRQRESLIGAVTMVLLPLTFLSSALMQQSLAPDWIGTVAKFNPVNWAVVAGRSAAMEHIDWGLVAGRIGLLFVLVVLAAAFATRAFGSYQRSL